MNAKKIVGYRKFNSKKGNACCILSLTVPFTDIDIEHGACGVKTEEIFIPGKCHELINPQVIGKQCEIYYGRSSDGQAYVADVVIK